MCSDNIFFAKGCRLSIAQKRKKKKSFANFSTYNRTTTPKGTMHVVKALTFSQCNRWVGIFAWFRSTNMVDSRNLETIERRNKSLFLYIKWPPGGTLLLRHCFPYTSHPTKHQ